MPPMTNKQGDADPAVRRAHAAFRTTANRRLRNLLELGVEGGAASSQLLDDLIAPRDLASSPPPQPATRTLPNSSGSTGGSGGGGGGGGGSSSSSSPSVQHVVACTGASPAQASKILLLREEISRLRRDGHSTADLIEQLRDRLRDVSAPRSGWSDDESENAEAVGARRDKAGVGASKKRRVADDACGIGSGIDLSEDKQYARLPGSPYLRDSLPRELCSDFAAHDYGGGGGGGLGGGGLSARAYSPPYRADLGASKGELGGGRGFNATVDKRHREEGAPLSALKKLKLRTAQQEGHQ